ncbi:hypothetical protein LEP1GSC150_5629 [Leptospira interrogans serovar Copenhageni str. LT2050]|uniref:Uncharacterized protein n=1 Tax=Leptospira interrogans serovar Copenhageni str. LT2050 TaxID=1001598 RepID=M3IJF4_LEPIT|nr:hypothetical protein LEP1GSC150_5629 [Leptospira interrogans serovar Copenhageni str. LT2050]
MKLLSKNFDAKKNLQWGLAKLPQLSISIHETNGKLIFQQLYSRNDKTTHGKIKKRLYSIRN